MIGSIGAWMVIWWAVGLLLLVLVVWGLVAASRTGSRSATPEQILKRRYARGEIEPSEYEQRLTDLRG